MPVYPEKIAQMLSTLQHCGAPKDIADIGRAVDLKCGCVVEFHTTIHDTAISSIRFRSNGCGFMVAAAEILAKNFSGSELKELGGGEIEIQQLLFELEIGEEFGERVICVETAIDAFRAALASHRERVSAEFVGESPLVCTCFGVTEEQIDEMISSNNVRTLEEITTYCRAGSGCGSCRMLIQDQLEGQVLRALE